MFLAPLAKIQMIRKMKIANIAPNFKKSNFDRKVKWTRSMLQMRLIATYIFMPMEESQEEVDLFK
jgi:hypothetical protein